MLKKMPLAEYKDTLYSKRRNGDNMHRHYAQCVHTLVSRWAARVTSHQLSILLFVLDRTMYHSKLSETIVFDQFLSGMEHGERNEMVFCGLNMSKNTLLLHLNELTEGDFLHAFACIGTNGKTEIKARLYAINCKKLFNLDIADEENPMILREPKAKRVRESDDFAVEEAPQTSRVLLKTPKNRVAPPSKSSPPNLGAIYIDNRITKVIHVDGPAAVETDGKFSVGSALANLHATREAMRQQRTSNRPTRPTRSAPNNPYSRVAIQGLLDTAMQSYFPAVPRMLVNDKALGVLRKRMVEAEVDRDQFLDWAIKLWQTTAGSHERGARKRVGEETVHTYKAMPRTPDFNTLAYRFPYFLSAFRSYLQAETAGLATTREELLERQVAKLQRTVESTRDEARSAQQRERTLRQRTRNAAPSQEAAAKPNRIVRRTPAPTLTEHLDPMVDDDLPPAWDDLPQKKA